MRGLRDVARRRAGAAVRAHHLRARRWTRYGIDRPDTRIQLELVDLTDVFARERVPRVPRRRSTRGGIVKCLPVHDADALTRGADRPARGVREEGARRQGARLGARRAPTARWQSPIAKFLSDAERAAITRAHAARARAACSSSRPTRAARANAILARLRVDLGQRLGRVDGRAPGTCSSWSTSRSSSATRTARSPTCTSRSWRRSTRTCRCSRRDPGAVRGTHYDVVMNGVELGSGSLRNHRADVQRRIFELIGYSKSETEQRFGFMLERARGRRAAARRLRVRLRPLGDGARGRARACAT